MKSRATPKHADTDPGPWLAQLHDDGPAGQSQAFQQQESPLPRPYVERAQGPVSAHEPSEAVSRPVPPAIRRQAGHPGSGTRRGLVQPRSLQTLGKDRRDQCPLFAAPPSLPDGQAAGSALIGDRLRRPILWCQMSSCVAWHADPAAIGEADNRARALAAGWREDALGRIACPACLQSSPEFRAMYPLVPWDSKRAVAMLILWEAATQHHRNTTSDAAATGTGWAPAMAPSRLKQPWAGLHACNSYTTLSTGCR
jgi:hypothetical protein